MYVESHGMMRADPLALLLYLPALATTLSVAQLLEDSKHRRNLPHPQPFILLVTKCPLKTL